MKKRLSIIACTVSFMLLMSISLSSCGILNPFMNMPRPQDPEFDVDSDISDTNDDPDNDAGDIFGDLSDADDVTQSDGKKPEDNSEEDGEKDNVIQNTIVIEGTSSDVSYAAASGLRSSVSVLAKHGTSGYATGSGVIASIYDDKGSAFIITNYHVVYYNGGISSDISVYLYGMQSSKYEIKATYVGGSPYYDVAVLKVENSDVLKKSVANGSVIAVKMADSDTVAPGNTAIAIGAPGVSDSTALSGISVTSGIVSVESEYITMTSINGVQETEFRVIRIDTAVNSGNSGGGLFNIKGELVGIVNAKISQSDVENIAYAIPSNVVHAVYTNIVDYCNNTDCQSVMRALVGVTLTVNSLYTEYDEKTGYLRAYEEVVVYGTEANGLSYGVFEVGDIVKSVQIGERITDVKKMYHIIDAMLYARVGDEVITTVKRNGQEIKVKMTITEDCLTAY